MHVSSPMFGTVTKNLDPDGLGRVKVRVPGYLEPETDKWCLPAGWPGSGGLEYGSRYPVPVGAQVMLFFEQGDSLAQGIYIPILYGKTQDGMAAGPTCVTNSPTGVVAAEQQVERVCLWEDQDLAIYVTMHEDDKRIALLHKTSGSNITIYGTDGADGKSTSIAIESTTDIRIKAIGLVDIQGSVVQINGKRAMPGPPSKPGGF